MIAFLVFLLAILNGPRTQAAPPLVQYPTLSPSAVRPPSDCKKYYHNVCNNWKIGEWLPTPIEGFEPWRQDLTTSVAFTDAFLYRGKHNSPDDGTHFVYGNAGPPKGTVVYDYARGIVFFSQGCCAWHSTVLAADIGTPPVPVVNRSLHDVRTVRGIAIGDTIARVESIYGKARLEHAQRAAQLQMLFYYHGFAHGCGQSQDFGFLHGRLVYIELLNGC